MGGCDVVSKSWIVLDLVTTQLFILVLSEEQYTHLSLAIHLCNNSGLTVFLPEVSR